MTFDAGGTLFSPRETVGETYARLARAHGIDVGAGALESGFDVAFGLAPPLVAPPGARGAELLAAERSWWCDVVRATLAHALAPDRTSPPDRFDAFFDATFAHYAEPDAWLLHEDALACVEDVASRGIRIAVVSNFDSRLHRLLAGLGLSAMLDGALASTEVGFAKPAAEIFTAAAARLGAEPAACLHVGDSLQADALGASAAGMTGVWLDRTGAEESARSAGVPRIRSLQELAALLG